jgi:hypothetical protein
MAMTMTCNGQELGELGPFRIGTDIQEICHSANIAIIKIESKEQLLNYIVKKDQSPETGIALKISNAIYQISGVPRSNNYLLFGKPFTGRYYSDPDGDFLYIPEFVINSDTLRDICLIFNHKKLKLIHAIVNDLRFSEISTNLSPTIEEGSNMAPCNTAPGKYTDKNVKLSYVSTKWQSGSIQANYIKFSSSNISCSNPGNRLLICDSGYTQLWGNN